MPESGAHHNYWVDYVIPALPMTSIGMVHSERCMGKVYVELFKITMGHCQHWRSDCNHSCEEGKWGKKLGSQSGRKGPNNTKCLAGWSKYLIWFTAHGINTHCINWSRINTFLIWILNLLRATGWGCRAPEVKPIICSFESKNNCTWLLMRGAFVLYSWSKLVHPTREPSSPFKSMTTKASHPGLFTSSAQVMWI